MIPWRILEWCLGAGRRTPSRFLGPLIAVLTGSLSVAGAPSTNDSGALAAPAPRDEVLASDTCQRSVEEDWLKQAESWRAARFPLTTRADAAGACDGVKNGQFGFHTGQDRNPWWQVDLGKTVEIGRVRVFNRLDYAPGLHNADRLQLLTSDDGTHWTLRYDNQGKPFGGIGAGGPLIVELIPVQARFVRLQLPSEQPVFFHLDEVEVSAAGDPAHNLALHCASDQSSLSPWSTVKRRPQDEVSGDYPVAETIMRGRRLAEELAQAGINVGSLRATLWQEEQRWQALGTSPTAEAARKVYLAARRVIRRLVFANPLLDFDRLLFVKRFTQETYPDVCLNHMPWVSRPGGDLCILSGESPARLFDVLADPSSPGGAGLKTSHLLSGALGSGHVHGMDLDWGGNRVVFGYARAKRNQPPEGWLDRTQSYRLRRTEEPIHIFELDLTGPRVNQLTSGEWSDLDPTYAPNGNVVFVSERCGTSLQCNEYDKDETSCNLYVMKPNGSGIRRLSANKDGDYLPHTLDDGTIAYTRWEYQERSWAYIQSIWIIRPDGTGADAIFKQHFVNPWALEDTRSIPGSAKLVSIAAGHHTLAMGPLVVVDTSRGINEPSGIHIVTPGVKPPEGGMDGVPVAEGGVMDSGGFYSTPWALSEKFFLVSYTYGKESDPTGYALYLVDVFGNKELVYRDPAISCFVPIPLRPRPRPPILPELADVAQTHADCVISDVGFGSEEVAARIRYVRVAEPIGWPYDNINGGQRYGEDHRYGGPGAEQKNLQNWTPIRILGDIPVERDGSVHFQVPADTAVYFQLLDENRMELRRMRSFISFQPGERRACVGCHESRGMAPRPGSPPLAATLPPSLPLPPPWGDRPVSFLRDIQPVLDRHCAPCHHGLKPAGGLDFGGGLISGDPEVAGYGHNRAYETILRKGLVSISAVRAQDASITPALAYGSHKSKLMQQLLRDPQPNQPIRSEEDRLRVAMWIDANAPYHDRFVNKRPEQPAYDLAADRDLEKRITAVHERRCGRCHKAAEVTRLDWIDLHQPDRSLFLRAPLAGKVAGEKHCSPAVYPGVQDPDYQAVRTAVFAAVKKAWAAPRRDLQALVEEKNPPSAQVKEASLNTRPWNPQSTRVHY